MRVDIKTWRRALANFLDLKKGIGELSRMIVGFSLLQIQVYSPFLDVKKE